MRFNRCAVIVVCGLFAGSVEAKVTRIEIQRRLPYADGVALERVGKYERVLGRVHFTLDPQDAANGQIIDLKQAPRNKQGLVEFSADLEILAPADLAKANGTLLYDVNNRGRRLALGAFQTGNDHFLLERGYIVVWSGWIAQVLPGEERLRMNAPVITRENRAVTSLVREEMIVDEPATRMTVSQWANQGAHEPTEAGLPQATLTWRMRETDLRVTVPREQWRLETKWAESEGQRGQMPLVECVLPGGFRPGYIYELIYEGQNPVVQGCGLAGIRDLISYLKHDRSDDHPLRLADGNSAGKRALGFGISQSGRCLRQMLYDGLNADEQGRQVFDGLMPHVAGGGLGFFNHHFASPTRHNGQHDNHLYPADVFPFAYGDEEDPFTGQQDGILRKARAAGVVPQIMHTQCSAEYWHRSGSLVHTDPRGLSDALLPDEVRVYGFGGSQHSAGSGVPGTATVGDHPLNPNDYRPLLRALLVSLDEWVRTDTSPPESVYPRVDERTLVGWRENESGWRALPGVRYPEVIQQPAWLDYGSDFATRRHITQHPPRYHLIGPDNRVATYGVRVPLYGSDNNEAGMLLTPSIAVPVATYTGWNLRSRTAGAEGEMFGLMGSYLPFARTREERIARGDPRPALLERYRDFDDYLARTKAAGEKLIESRCLLAEDLALVLEQARRNQSLFK